MDTLRRINKREEEQLEEVERERENMCKWEKIKE